jgi:hypothetical protein
MWYTKLTRQAVSILLTSCIPGDFVINLTLCTERQNDDCLDLRTDIRFFIKEVYKCGTCLLTYFPCYKKNSVYEIMMSVYVSEYPNITT